MNNNNGNTELEVIEPTPVSVIYEQDRAQIDVQISTAKAYPRNVKRATENAIAIVSIDEETAHTCTYSVPRAGKAITGPSVHLARILAQTWGNLRIESKVVAEDAKHVTSEAICFDLETNIAMKAQVKRPITGKGGRKFSDDMVTVTGNAANAIALRNAIFNVIPKGVVNAVYKAAQQKITGDVSNENKLKAKRKQVIDGLKGAYDVTESEILSAIGKASVDHVTADDIVVLIGIGTAIRDGDTTIDQAFRGKNTNEKPDPDEVSDAKQIERLKKHIAKATSINFLEQVKDHCSEGELKELYDAKYEELQS